MNEPKGSTTQPRQGPTGAAANAVSIESLREGLVQIAEPAQGMDDLEPYFQAQSAALTELAALRESDASLRAENERLRLIETGAKDSEALVAHLRAENERLRLIETGAKDSEALVAHLRAENEALRKANAEYLCYCQPEVHADGVTDPAVTCPRCALRAENARLVAERDALKQWHDQHEEREAASCPEDVGCIEFIGYLKDSLTAERARADAMAARANTLMEFIHQQNSGYPGCNICGAEVEGDDSHAEDCGVQAILVQTPAQALSARDARVRREALGTGGVEAIAAERRRQIEVEGWTPEHDDEHGQGELATAAASYAMARHESDSSLASWPWAMRWWKPKDRRKNLVRAGALIAAEIDRLDRKAAILGPESQDNEQETK